MPENTTITAIDGLLVGQSTNIDARTGCTVILCPQGFTPGLAVPGFATGSRETELLRPEALVESVHGIVLAGGSAFGLAAADGVMRFARERGYGFAMPHGCVPIISGAVLYDLDNNRQVGLLPDANMGYDAARRASNAPVTQGRVGAGTGTLCGRLYALDDSDSGVLCDAGGVGSALRQWGGVKVAALAAVNALGNIYHPQTYEFVAGGRDASGKPMDAEATLRVLARVGQGPGCGMGEQGPGCGPGCWTDKAGQGTGKGAGHAGYGPSCNTVLCVVATNVPLSKVQTTRLARMAGAGLARVINPVHLTLDGDMVFALAAKEPLAAGVEWSEDLLGALGAEALAHAVCAAVSKKI